MFLKQKIPLKLLFKQHPLGVFSFCLIIFTGFISIFVYCIAPDSSQHANQMHLSIHSKPPLFEAIILKIPAQNKTSQNILNTLFLGQKNNEREIPIKNYKINPNTLSYTTYSGLEKSITLDVFPKRNVSDFIENRKFWFGTDKYGRDYLSRILVGTRISFFIGITAVLISLLIGIFMGSLSGYFGGWIDRLIMWIINITWSIPTLLLVIAITLVLGKGIWQVFIAVGLTMWVEIARIVRGQILSIKEEQYIIATKALGYSHFRIITKHILPNIMAPVIVISAANFASAILIESGLSFLGLGAQPPVTSWGAMIKNHYNDIILGKPYLAIIPGLCIISLVTSCMLVGNMLRDILDYKQ